MLHTDERAGESDGIDDFVVRFEGLLKQVRVFDSVDHERAGRIAQMAERLDPPFVKIQEMARQLQGPVTQQVEQAMRNMPSAEEIQEMARQLQGPVTQQVEEAVQQLPQPMQEALNEPIIITPQSVNTGNSNGSKSKRRSKSKSKWTYGVPGMTGGEGNGPLIYNP